ncbi:hypothetical protein [Nocardia sp. NBC_01327]|uniref:hypothetical protein n=1 Tax=Nocardia sp. NBC_01327 TaxID=2903593 RepID=UPI002E1520CB|nr:hypothetical protein OG326_18495 [Nocardia sp. NBC_01327]
MSLPADVQNTRAQTTESLLDRLNWQGLALLLLGIIALGPTLTASGNGLGGWEAFGIAASATGLVGGVLGVVVEIHRERIRRR